MKGESVEEIAAFASTLREYSLKISPVVNGRMVDTCGTGGDRIKTPNVSTIAAFIAAGAGVIVAKHGNRSVTSKCGSADLLEKLGFNVNMEPNRVKESIEQVGIGFMFAPSFHPALKRVAPVRRELAIRTIFNIMGPLINPANVTAQLLGVYSPSLTLHLARVLKMLGREETMVIHGLEGIDEISVTSKTRISWLRDGEITTKEYEPKDFGITGVMNEPITVSSIDDSILAALRILTGRRNDGVIMNMMLVNAAASIVLGGRAKTFQEGLLAARESIKSDAAFKKLEELIRFSGGDASNLEEYRERA
jgi:anthranilate phosphoribosyltransferase